MIAFMKKILIVLCITISASGVFAQVLATANSPEYRNILKMSVSLFTQSTFQLGLERFVNPTTSVYVTAGFSLQNSDYENNWGIRNEVQMKFHVYSLIKPTTSQRLYFAPYLMNQYYETEHRVYDTYGNPYWKSDSYDAFSGGMLFGWSFTFANRINLDIYTGGGIRKTFNYVPADDYYNNDVFESSYSGIVPRLGIDIGFWF
jgi:hypothetical protein